MSRSLKSVKSKPLAGRIKKVMQTDEDVGKIAQGAPVLMSRAMELFLSKLCEGTAAVATGGHARTATPSHLKAFVTSNGKLDFLAEKFASVPNYVDKDMPAKKPRVEADLTSSSSGPQLSPGSPPAGSKAVRGRGRGRTRGRGSVRISADNSRQVQYKEEQETDAAADSMSSAMHGQHTVSSEAPKTLMDVSVRADPLASDSAVLQVQGSAQTAADRTSDNSDAPAQALLTAVNRGSAVLDIADHDISMSAVSEPSMQQAAQLLKQPLAPAAGSLTAVSPMPAKQSDLLVEEDDYDADEF
ncbi:hypothetical protein WJX77_005505 [Trebouxia sp. C0004]